MVATLHKMPIIPMPYVDEVARIAKHRASRRPLQLDMFLANRWIYHQDHLARVQAWSAAVEKPQPVQPEPQPFLNETFTYSLSAFRGWRKKAMYVVGLLDNVCHIGRVGA